MNTMDAYVASKKYARIFACENFAVQSNLSELTGTTRSASELGNNLQQGNSWNVEVYSSPTIHVIRTSLIDLCNTIEQTEDVNVVVLIVLMTYGIVSGTNRRIFASCTNTPNPYHSFHDEFLCLSGLYSNLFQRNRKLYRIHINEMCSLVDRNLYVRENDNEQADHADSLHINLSLPNRPAWNNFAMIFNRVFFTKVLALNNLGMLSESFSAFVKEYSRQVLLYFELNRTNFVNTILQNQEFLDVFLPRNLVLPENQINAFLEDQLRNYVRQLDKRFFGDIMNIILNGSNLSRIRFDARPSFNGAEINAIIPIGDEDLSITITDSKRGNIIRREDIYRAERTQVIQRTIVLNGLLASTKYSYEIQVVQSQEKQVKAFKTKPRGPVIIGKIVLPRANLGTDYEIYKPKGGFLIPHVHIPRNWKYFFKYRKEGETNFRTYLKSPFDLGDLYYFYPGKYEATFEDRYGDMGEVIRFEILPHSYIQTQNNQITENALFQKYVTEDLHSRTYFVKSRNEFIQKRIHKLHMKEGCRNAYEMVFVDELTEDEKRFGLCQICAFVNFNVNNLNLRQLNIN
eukprot:TRINITY_DN6420_c0_g1_i1.p1 TRINITY_DN6420_c0_g1~~TRINITY_DN6420_c0_g1_i1.p1  ORF type:complete len:572 (-),score=12.32 TRINITY_DN6420_c0_g1_i1:19-1734(-)